MTAAPSARACPATGPGAIVYGDARAGAAGQSGCSSPSLFTLAFAGAGPRRGGRTSSPCSTAIGITGEIIRLERGRLEFKTDDAGTLYLEWDKLASLVAMRRFEVLTTDGLRFLGIARPRDRPLIPIVVTAASASAAR